MPGEAVAEKPARRTRKAEQAAATRAVLLRVARDLFTARGYGATGTEEIVEQAGMTMGALYYHFKDKRDLFRAVFELVEAEFDQIGREAAQQEKEPWTAFTAACIANVDACRRPDIHQICLMDAPSVLGWETWRRIDGAYSMKSMRSGLRALMTVGEIAEEPTAPLAALLVGALNEAGLSIAHAEDPVAAREPVVAALLRLLERLRVAK